VWLWLGIVGNGAGANLGESFMRIKWLLIGVSACLLAACASSRKAADKDKDGVAVVHSDSDEAGPPVSKEEISSKEIEANVERSYRSEYGEVNLKVNSLVEKWIGYFQGRGRHWMELYLSRSTRYMPMMKNTLREYGLPEDLVYVAMIESGFSPVAHSRAAAVGYWQFVRATARTYGLTVNRYIDERRDPVLSTRAAAEYFKALYNLFGSWHLALASYNSGENRVKNVVMKNFTRDFWELVRLRKIPPETQNYVPKFIAAAIIAKDPGHYGFTDIEYEPSLDYDTIAVPNAVSLRKLAQNIEVDYDDLRLLNPKYRSDYVPVYPHVETVLRVPT
jgi:membrane-bound lytic murein transglycosylase D